MQSQREPFTLADVLNSINEVKAREHSAANTSSPLTIDHAERGTQPVQALGWMARLRTMFKRRSSSTAVQVPQIIIHPCDGTPSFSFDDYDNKPSSSQPRITIRYAPPVSSTASVPTTPSVSPMSSPTISEPDSPGPVTPEMTHTSYFPTPTIVTVSTVECLEVPMPSSTAPRNMASELGDADVPVNMSNFSGKQFVLGAPPKRAGGVGRWGSLVASASRGSLPVGLGLGDLYSSEDFTGSTYSESDSENSVADLVSILESIATSSSTDSDVAIPPSASDDSTVLRPSRKRFAYLLDGPSGVNADPTDTDDEDEDEDEWSSVTSGDTDYYECSSDSSFGLGFDLEAMVDV